MSLEWKPVGEAPEGKMLVLLRRTSGSDVRTLELGARLGSHWISSSGRRLESVWTEFAEIGALP